MNGHEGLVGSFGADRIWRDGDRYVFSIGPRVLFSDAKYQRAYFGVDNAAALASGLPAYRPSGGIHAVAMTSSGTTLEPSKPQLLFRSRLPVISAVVEQYRVTSDGGRFLFCVPLTSVQQEPLRAVVNWPERLRVSR